MKSLLLTLSLAVVLTGVGADQQELAKRYLYPAR